MTQLQLLPTFYNNHSLFSGFYLDELVLQDSHWKRMAAQVHELRQQIAQAYEVGMQGLTEETPEAEVERRLIRPILTLLGHHFYVQKNVPTPEGQKYPDYAFFSSGVDQITAEGQKDRTAFFQNAIAVGEAKRWDRPLDRRLRGRGDPFTNQNPSYQIDFYLRATGKTWGILTNGRLWRLYYRDLSYRLDVYYEVNLPDLLMQSDEAFLYFLAFFCKDAFLSESTGEAFPNRAYKQSIDYAVRLGDELKENVYEALRLLVEGFLRYPSNHLGDQDVAAVREHAFTAIYRLLFVFYSESPRKSEFLLPIDNLTYRNTYSLRALAEEVTTRLDNNVALSPTATTYWARLLELFRLIDEGDAHLGVPTYNGGLFDNDKHPFLVDKRVGDVYLARAIDLLARAAVSGQSGRGFVTYGDLGVRELGSIYEGLLEHQPRVAQEPMVAVRDDKRERVVPEKEARGKKILVRYDTGQVYLTLHQGERKATGSYYTPDYIVKYIVQNTLGPLLEETRQRGDDQFDSILALKVLDPAMGSGHFLVEATDYLARALVEALGEASAEREDDIRWARREIVEGCIYGVDLNPLAVELAKLSLWLHTASKDKPLNFLDHHLRCGDSLMGAWVPELGILPAPGKKGKALPAGTTLVGHQFTSAVAAAVNSFHIIMEAPSATIEDIHRKEGAYETARYALRRVKDVADVWTSAYFGNEVKGKEKDAYEHLLQSAEDGTGNWSADGQLPWLDKARGLAQEKHFFHWELEFPELYFDRDGQKLETPGFDAVIGNPPYENAWLMTEDDSTIRSTILSLNNALELLEGHWDLYIAFIVRSLRLLRAGGFHSFIVPDALLREKYAASLRRYILKQTIVRRILDFGETNVFPDVSRHCVVYVIQALQSDGTAMTIVEKPSAPQMTEMHFAGALPQAEWLELEGVQIRTELSDAMVRQVSKKVFSHSIRLGQICYVMVGATTHSKDGTSFKKADVVTRSPVGDAHKFIDGKTLSRYEIQYDGRYIDYRREAMYGPRVPELFESEKLVVRDVTGDNEQLIVSFDDKGYYSDHTISCVVYYESVEATGAEMGFEGYARISPPYPSLQFLTSILASRLMTFVFGLHFATGTLQGSYSHTYPQQIRAFPIRRIKFDTPQALRVERLEEARRLYLATLQTGDRAPLLRLVDAALPRLPNGSPDTEREESDVVHDFLALLAESMLRLHEDKDSEVERFLSWFQSYVGAPLESMKSKTIFREYWKPDSTWQEFRDALVQNKQRVTKVTLPGYQAEQPIKEGFETSRNSVEGFLVQIERTDWLIDQIVYKLYGLTDEEITIVGRRERAVYARERE